MYNILLQCVQRKVYELVETQGNEKNNITWKIQKQKYREKNLTENTENWTLKKRRKIT